MVNATFRRTYRRLTLALLAVLGAAQASACVLIVDPHPTSLWERIWDWTPPAALPSAPDVRVRRGVGPEVDGDVAYSTSCDDIGYVQLTFSEPRESGGEVVGHAFEVLSGQAPAGFLHTQPLRTIRHRDGTRTLTLAWIDGATYEQEPLAFVLGIRTVDRAGNKSRDMTAVLVRDPGREVP